MQMMTSEGIGWRDLSALSMLLPREDGSVQDMLGNRQSHRQDYNGEGIQEENSKLALL